MQRPILERTRSGRSKITSDHFLTITDGFESLRPLGEMTLWKGAQDIVFDHG